MKRFALFFAAAVVLVLAYSGDSTQAGKIAFFDRYNAADTKGETGVYEFDRAHTFIGFHVNHLGLIEVPGYFRDFSGTINYNAEDITKSSVKFTAKIASVDTGVEGRDAHLRRADFFDAEKYPEMTFISKKVEKRGNSVYLTGDLTLRGITKEVSFPFEIKGFLPGNERQGMRMGATASTQIDRFDFGVDYGKNAPAGRPGIANNVKVDLRIEALKQKPSDNAAE